MIERELVSDALQVFAQQRRLAENAAAQLGDDEFFRALAEDSNSVAILMKHVGGNLRSRWTDFLTTDGEKPDRNRDGEFIAEGETRDAVMQIWNEGFDRCTETLRALTPEDLTRTVTIRGEPHSVVQALIRSLAHISHHAGQIVLVAKALRASQWQVLSIPRNKSEFARGNFWKTDPGS